MKIIGVTGTSGAGKTTLCEILNRQYGAYIIDADQIAKRLSKKGTMYLNAIVECFGDGILNQEGELRRKELANLIYNDEGKRSQLNGLTFMYVVQEIKEKIDALREDCIVIDAPLLFESKLDQICDFVIGVIAKEEEKIERICKRDGISKEMAKKRLSIQMEEKELSKKADYIIVNDGNVENLEKEIEKVWKERKE